MCTGVCVCVWFIYVPMSLVSPEYIHIRTYIHHGSVCTSKVCTCMEYGICVCTYTSTVWSLSWCMYIPRVYDANKQCHIYVVV